MIMEYYNAQIINSIDKHIKTNIFSEDDLSELVRFMRQEIMRIDQDFANEILEIVIIALNNATLKEPQVEWANKNGDYFAGNVVAAPNDLFMKYYNTFTSKNFSLSDIAKFVNDINSDFYNSKNDFYLRIPEVILRDDVTIIPSELSKLCIKVKKLIDNF